VPLPLTTRPLVGRDGEVDAVRALIVDEHTRLVTLVGPGGVGKTRLALAVADLLGDHFADGASFVDLAPVRDPGLVLATIAEALGIHETPTQSLLTALTNALAGRSQLLVLDNFEQVVRGAQVLPRVLELCAGVYIVASSREPLGISWEQQFQVAPLPSDAAAALFVQQARTVRPNFALSASSAATVAEICRRLDGLPLAIELAAARTRVLSPEAILGQLRERPLSLLSGGARDAPERHRALRETIAASYDLLEADEQALFRELSVFVGGCPLAAVETLATLEALVDKHLVRTEEIDDEVRARMLETIREFGSEQLTAVGALDLASERMAMWLVDLAEQAAPALYGREQHVWMARLAREHDNIRAALDWCADARDPSALELGLRLGGALWLFWRVRGFVREGRARLARLLARPGEATRARARALYAAGYLAFAYGAAEEARPLLEESRAMAEAAGDTWTQGYALQGLGHVELLNGNLLRANALYAERLDVARAQGDDYGLAQAWNALGEVARCLDEPSRAREMYEQSLALRRRLGDARGVGMGLANLGHVLLAEGDVLAARRTLREAAAVALELEHRYGVAICLSGFAAVALVDGDPARAARLIGATVTTLEQVGSALEPPDRLAYERTVDAVRASLGPARYTALTVEGQALSMEDVLVLVDAAVEEARPTVPSEIDALSAREREVAMLIARGQTSQGIAAALVITRRTADTHAAHIRDKLGLRSRAEIAAWATRHGLV
jgi:non-specific serine/threonine protein kinase